jgi:hypothetical protein
VIKTFPGLFSRNISQPRAIDIDFRRNEEKDRSNNDEEQAVTKNWVLLSLQWKITPIVNSCEASRRILPVSIYNPTGPGVFPRGRNGVAPCEAIFDLSLFLDLGLRGKGQAK